MVSKKVVAGVIGTLAGVVVGLTLSQKPKEAGKEANPVIESKQSASQSPQPGPFFSYQPSATGEVENELVATLVKQGLIKDVQGLVTSQFGSIRGDTYIMKEGSGLVVRPYKETADFKVDPNALKNVQDFFSYVSPELHVPRLRFVVPRSLNEIEKARLTDEILVYAVDAVEEGHALRMVCATDKGMVNYPFLATFPRGGMAYETVLPQKDTKGNLAAVSWKNGHILLPKRDNDPIRSKVLLATEVLHTQFQLRGRAAVQKRLDRLPLEQRLNALGGIISEVRALGEGPVHGLGYAFTNLTFPANQVEMVVHEDQSDEYYTGINEAYSRALKEGPPAVLSRYMTKLSE